MVRHTGNANQFLEYVPKRSHVWREQPKLTDFTSDKPRVAKGRLLVRRHWDILQAPHPGSGRALREQAQKIVDPVRRVDFRVIDNTNCHELLSTCSFSIQGSFADRGSPFSRAVRDVARKLDLVGFIRTRSRGSLGKIQGPVMHVGHLKRWLTSGLVESRQCKIKTIRFSDENVGLERTDYRDFQIAFDRRSVNTQMAATRTGLRRKAAGDYFRECNLAARKHIAYRKMNLLADDLVAV